MLHPAEICTHPWKSRSRLAGRWPVKPSNSKKPCAVSESLVRNSASLWTCPGPKATSTNGNCRNTSSLTDCAQHPPTPITRSGSRRLSIFALCRCEMKRSSAFSRLEHALHALRVVLVHLAAERRHVVALHGAKSSPVKRPGSALGADGDRAPD